MKKEEKKKKKKMSTPTQRRSDTCNARISHNRNSRRKVGWARYVEFKRPKSENNLEMISGRQTKKTGTSSTPKKEKGLLYMGRSGYHTLSSSSGFFLFCFFLSFFRFITRNSTPTIHAITFNSRNMSCPNGVIVKHQR